MGKFPSHPPRYCNEAGQGLEYVVTVAQQTQQAGPKPGHDSSKMLIHCHHGHGASRGSCCFYCKIPLSHQTWTTSKIAPNSSLTTFSSYGMVSKECFFSKKNLQHLWCNCNSANATWVLRCVDVAGEGPKMA